MPSIGFDGSASGITIKRLIVDRVPKGAKVVAKCSGLRVADGQGQALRARLALQARGQERARRHQGRDPRHAGQDRHGTYVYGATGSYFEWPVRRAASARA